MISLSHFDDPLSPANQPSFSGSIQECIKSIVVTPQEPALQSASDPSAGVYLPEDGAIALLKSGQVCIIYKETASSARRWPIILILNPDGTLLPEDADQLNDGEWEQIGQIPSEYLPHLLGTLMWNRDHIVFHLDKFTHVRFVPSIKTDQQPTTIDELKPAKLPNPTREEAPVPTVTSGDSLFQRLARGQRFTIAFSKGRAWEAVFWCEDSEGTVVIQKTNGGWTPIRLDLTRFKDTLSISGMISENELREVEHALWGLK